MTQLPLITETLFKQHSPVTQNTDIAEFVPYICIAQELHIQPILGDALMNDLKEQIEHNVLTESGSELVLRIAPALSFYAVYQALPFHWAAIVNKGITIRKSENSKEVDVTDIAQLRQWLKLDADMLKNQLVDFLERNQENYPLWRPQHTAHDGACGERGKCFDSGFYFPKR